MGRLRHWWRDRRYGRSGLDTQWRIYGLEEASEGAAKGNGEGGFSLRMGGARCRDRDEVYDRG